MCSVQYPPTFRYGDLGLTLLIALLAILVFVNLINYADRYSLSAVLGVSLFLIVQLFVAWWGPSLHDFLYKLGPKRRTMGPMLAKPCGPAS